MTQKCVLITGGNSGIGLETAKAFLALGYKVIISGRSESSLAEAQASLSRKDVLTVVADVSSTASIEAMIAQLQAQHIMLDCLVVNAGIATPQPFEAVTVENFDQQVNTNFKGAFFSLRYALPMMNNPSTAIFVTSITNRVATAGFSVYAGTKAAVKTMVSTVAVELIGKGIRVNAVSPGPIETPIFDKLGVEKAKMDSRKLELIEQVPAKRFGQPNEIADLICYLASEQSSYIVGQEIAACGGRSLL